MADTDIRRATAAERRELAELLAGLPGDAWDAPTLCAGWRVREVVAHMTMPFRLRPARFAGYLIAARGNFDRMADRRARADAAALSPRELTAALRDNAEHPWKPPGGRPEAALAHDVTHGLDITVALGLDRRVPEDRMRLVLAGADNPRAVRYFGVDLTGVQLSATDLDWTYGTGTAVRGTAQDLLLVLSGRALPPGRLDGAPGARFTAV
ncbi:MAG TPA: maleylpyruvate isomerase family mycothiol-dependent enzyme [Streptosporangiaceae bacterium]|jgi:uncharacterized protein (TIGR03083 family)